MENILAFSVGTLGIGFCVVTARLTLYGLFRAMEHLQR
jgi:hypothetical protein